MVRSLAVAVLLAIALGYVILTRRIEDAEDDGQDVGDYGPLPTAFRIGRTGAYIH